MPPPLIIDLRCLQDPDYAERGIGNHTRCIVHAAPEPFTGLIDPALPPLPEDIAVRADRLTPHAYLPALAPGSVFLNPAPMGRNPLALARLLRDPNITKAAVVYDFIPYDAPETYLTTPAKRLEYATALAWLRQYDVFLPISAASQTRLFELFGPVQAHITGVALSDWMHDIPPEPPRHIFMAGGGDARKNPETLARAHAASPILRQIPLIIGGSCTPKTAARLRAITRVALPGHITNAELRRFFAQSYCVVTPSYAEGFSLPVIEAMAAHSPAIVSDIPAHRELVPDPAQRFAPDDAPALAAILEEIVTSPAHRAAIREAQAPRLQNFTQPAVAAKIWAHLAPKSPAILRGAKPRLALLTPLPPAKSGIADHSAALIAALTPLVRITVFSGRNLSALAHLDRQFDHVLSIVGNSQHHHRAYDLALQHGSAVLCHDSRLLGLATGRGLAVGAQIARRELNRPVTEAEILAWTEDETLREASFLGDLAVAARPLIFHSPQPAALVQARFGVTAKHLPFAIYRPFPGALDPAARSAARRALNLPEGEKIIASFGFITAQKGIEVALHAFAQLRSATPCRLIFVGEATSHVADYKAEPVGEGLGDRVVFGEDLASEATYRNHLVAANAALQLREGQPGNISGALQDCIAAGLPGVANQDLADNIFAPGYIARVPDALNAAQIAEALAQTLDTPRDTEAERREYCETYSMTRYARLLLDAL
jgi:glycosyltransferase involved in cell wall biosynthesis